ncbi:MAG: helix-turn-helix domain-containing protein [Flavobacteriaceae bacterium]
MPFYDVLLVIGAVVVSHCFFLVFVLMRLSRKLSNWLLTLLLLFLAIRVAACIGGLLYPDFEFTGSYLTGLSMALIGPLFYYYQISLWNPSLKLKSRDYIHLVPAGIILGLAPLLNPKVLAVVYSAGALIMVIYIGACIINMYRTSAAKRTDEVRWKWTLYLNWGLGMVILLFVGQLFLFREYVYAASVLATALVSYFLSIWAVKHIKLFLQEPRLKNGQKEKVTALGKQIERVLKEEAIFTDPLLTVSRLAKQLSVPPYLVSLAINDYFEKSFPEILSEFRIKKAEQLLTDYEKKHYTVEAIAYESGFNTLSAFYSAFKKITQKTPLQYRKHVEQLVVQSAKR